MKRMSDGVLIVEHLCKTDSNINSTELISWVSASFLFSQNLQYTSRHDVTTSRLAAESHGRYNKEPIHIITPSSYIWATY